MDWLKKKINSSKSQNGKDRNLRETSLNAYIRTLQKLHERMFNKKEFKNLDWLEDYEKIMETIDEKSSISTQKTTLASIIVALSSEKDYDDELVKTYQDEMIDLQKTYNTEEAKQEMNEKQKQNWVSLKRLYDVLKEYKRWIDKNDVMKKNKDTITNKEFNILQRWVVGNLYLGSDNHPPNRLDYVMDIINKKDYDKLSDEDKDKRNYLVIQGRNRKMVLLRAIQDQ